MSEPKAQISGISLEDIEEMRAKLMYLYNSGEPLPALLDKLMTERNAMLYGKEIFRDGQRVIFEYEGRQYRFARNPNFGPAEVVER